MLKIYFLLFAGGLILTFGDILMKKWAITNNYKIYSIGIFLYLIASMFLAATFKEKNIAVASLIYIIFNILTLYFVSWWFFGEPLKPQQIAGLTLGIISIVIIELA